MSKELQKRGLSLLGTGLIAAAAVGFLTGTRPPPEQSELPESVESSAAVGVARSYRDLRQGRRGPNASMYESAFAQLRDQRPGLLDPVEQTEEERLLALESRGTRRAYSGAPPTVPHPIQQREAAACLVCHGKGSEIAGLRAPMMSHREYLMCVQCHTPTRSEDSGMQALGSVGDVNTFIGVAEPGRGQTAWQGAPPTIPHQTFMRETCNSCHGPLGAQGLRTPHPARVSCTQCHAQAAPFDTGAPPPYEASTWLDAPPSLKPRRASARSE